MTALENYNEFIEAQKVIGYTLGDIEGTPEADMLKYTVLKLAKAAEERSIKAFNDYKKGRYSELEMKHDGERIALGQELQVLEDNNYEIPQ